MSDSNRRWIDLRDRDGSGRLWARYCPEKGQIELQQHRQRVIFDLEATTRRGLAKVVEFERLPRDDEERAIW